MIDGFQRLWHDAIIGSDNQHDDVGYLCASGAHSGKRLVTWRIDEYDLAAILLDMVRADMLRDAAGFAVGNARQTNGIEQRCLSVIDMAHDGDDGRTPDQICLLLGKLDILRRFLLRS